MTDLQKIFAKMEPLNEEDLQEFIRRFDEAKRLVESETEKDMDLIRQEIRATVNRK